MLLRDTEFVQTISRYQCLKFWFWNRCNYQVIFLFYHFLIYKLLKYFRTYFEKLYFNIIMFLSDKLDTEPILLFGEGKQSTEKSLPSTAKRPWSVVFPWCNERGELKRNIHSCVCIEFRRDGWKVFHSLFNSEFKHMLPCYSSPLFLVEVMSNCA